MAEKTPVVTTPSPEAVAKLKELATDRVKRACQAINSVGNLGEFSPNQKQQDAMVAAMQAALDDAKKSLSSPAAATGAFELPA